jgi:hypothetical protein
VRALPRVASLLLLALAFASGAAAAATIPVLYDGEFDGFVPVVDGIERPDLVAERRAGRVPETARRAQREASRALRRALRRGGTIPASLLPDGACTDRDELSRRWRRRHAIESTISVLDGAGVPIEGARVFRYYDPWFYPVNVDANGARLVGVLRYLPHPNPAQKALETVTLHLEHWRDEGFVDVAARPADIDHRCNPFVDLAGRVEPAPALEYVGRTGPGGELETVSGVFNLRDPRRFPRAIVPAALRIGYVVVADGYSPALSEQRFARGGQQDERIVHLLRAPSWRLFVSREMQVARAMVATLSLGPDTSPAALEAQLEAILGRLDGALARVPEADRPGAFADAAGALAEEAIRRMPPAHRLQIARFSLGHDPDDPARLYRLAAALAADERVRPGREPRTVTPPTPGLVEAERLLVRSIRAAPGFLPSHALLDTLLERRGAPPEQRLRLGRRTLAETPFAPVVRGRMAALLLESGRAVEAFDHLRYTLMTIPGLGGQRQLARSLAEHYWRLGLVEKSALWPFLLTGRPPEDPLVHPRRRRPTAAGS